jgi:hypothetical protein
MTGNHELLDIKPKAAVAFALGLMLMIGGALATTFFLFDYFVPRAGVTPNFATEVQSFPEPRLQIAPSQDLETLNEANRQKLESYGWVDRSAGVARIPIDRAMDIVVIQGWQERVHEDR